MKDYKIVLAQINPTVGDIKNNFKKILKTTKKFNKKADLIIFPELSLSGYPPEDLIFRASFIHEINDYINKIKEQCRDLEIAVIVGAPLKYKKEVRNAAIFFYKRKKQIIYKNNLPNYGVFDEKRVFVSGKKYDCIKHKNHKLGLLICEDMWTKELPKYLMKQGADIFLSINASPYDFEKDAQRKEAARKITKMSGISLAYINQIGGQDELVFDGGSFLIGPKGNVLRQLNYWSEDTKIINLNYTKEKQNIQFSPELSEQENIWNALIIGLRDYVRKNSFTKVILGLSGGIDSALSATIAVDALGHDRVIGLLMPSMYSSKSSLQDAKQLAKVLNIKTQIIQIKEIHKTYIDILKKKFKSKMRNITNENLQSRIRGILLMAYSNNFSYLLISTGNKSEMSVGYSTIYGDMNGGFNVLKDIYKTQVYSLSKWRNSQSNHNFLGPDGTTIPINSITKEPTAELNFNQKDTDSLPPYDILDKILFYLIEKEYSIDDLIKKGFKKKLVVKIRNLLIKSEYKRRQSPPGVKLSIKSFGKERRYPITNLFDQ